MNKIAVKKYKNRIYDIWNQMIKKNLVTWSSKLKLQVGITMVASENIYLTNLLRSQKCACYFIVFYNNMSSSKEILYEN